MKDIIFKGCATAIVTPFDQENQINFDEFKRLVDFQINNKVEAIVVCGTTGEAATLSKEEKQELIKYCVKIVDKKIPVIVGIGGNNTENVVENEIYAEKIGADGVLAVTPYYNKTTQKGLIEHYKAVAGNTSLPIILYNVPSRTGIDISPETYYELSKIPNIVATKEAGKDISKILRIRYLCKEELNIYSGNDDQIIPILSLGGIGAISVISNIIPRATSEMINKYLKGEIFESSKMQIQATRIIDLLFEEVNPIPIKQALNIKGFNVGKPRMPLVECSSNLKSTLETCLKDIN